MTLGKAIKGHRTTEVCLEKIFRQVFHFCEQWRTQSWNFSKSRKNSTLLLSFTEYLVWEIARASCEPSPGVWSLGCLWDHYNITPPVLHTVLHTVWLLLLWPDSRTIVSYSGLPSQFSKTNFDFINKIRALKWLYIFYINYWFSLERKLSVFCLIIWVPVRVDVNALLCRADTAESSLSRASSFIVNTEYRQPVTAMPWYWALHWGGERGPLLSSRDKWGSVNVNGPS